jgi:hypothetical protein
VPVHLVSQLVAKLRMIVRAQSLAARAFEQRARRVWAWEEGEAVAGLPVLPVPALPLPAAVSAWCAAPSSELSG